MLYPQPGTKRWKNLKADHIEQMWQKTVEDRLKQETEGQTKRRQDDYEDRIAKMLEQKTAILLKEQRDMKEENDVLRNMIRTKCVENSELLVHLKVCYLVLV